MTTQNLDSFSNDVFNRKVIAENLTTIIKSQSKPMVISLDSDWGTGKTTFVTMWKDLLDNDHNYKNDFKTLYFNAWENDYIKDPLLAIFSEIESQIKEEDPALKQQLDNVKSKIAPFLKLALTSGLKLGTSGLVNLDNIKLGDSTEEQLIGLAGELGSLAINEISASKKVRSELREEMAKYQIKSEKKIIFFIDELDRCRPSFAIELLEVIKHLFDIDNFIFIISIDKEQLSHSVATIYGQNMDTIGYLRKFFDLDYKLPSLDIKKYIDIKNSLVLNKYNNVEYLKVFIKEMFIINNFSLRDIDKAYYYIEILLPLIEEFPKSKKPEEDTKCPKWDDIHIVTISYIYSIFISTKIKDPLLYKKIINIDYDINEITKNFTIPNFDYYKDGIGSFDTIDIQELVKPILKMYLDLNLNTDNLDELYTMAASEFFVGLKKENGAFRDDRYIDLISLYEDGALNINNKLEFIEGF